MKFKIPFQSKRSRWVTAFVLAACAAVSKAPAAETNAPAKPVEPPLKPEEYFEGGKESFNNWIEFSTGGYLIDGNKREFQQRHRTGQVFGGIEDFHYSTELTNKTTVTIDGRAIGDNGDYKLRLDLAREKVGYLRFLYKQSRTWYNGDGGYDPASGTWYPLQRDDALSLDRGEISFEGGLRLDKKPAITFNYTHRFREGEKSSTMWAIAHPDGPLDRPTIGVSPSFYDINEHSDSFSLDVTHTIKPFDFGLGVRYEFGKMDDTLKIHQSPGEGSPAEARITDSQGTKYHLLNVHGFAESWLKKNVFFSTGFSVSDLDNDFSGSRIYGTDFGVGYVPNANYGAGYYGLTGDSHAQEYVWNLNLLTIPAKNFTIIPSIRVQKETTDADSSALQTSRDYAAVPITGNSDRDLIDVRERVDMRYTGVTNWVFTARGEWTEGQGNLREFGGTGLMNGTGIPPIDRQTDDSHLFQKYSVGATWYATSKMSIDAGGYYKLNSYDYSNNRDSTANDSGDSYPAFLVMQDLDTYDGSIRLTLRPHSKVTLVSRYEYQYSTIHTKPDAVSGLANVEASQMASHILGQNISWTPLTRLCFQVGFNYVLSETKTPASDYTQAILNAQNNYWTLNFNSGFVIDDKTDLNVGYFYYRADNYSDISAYGVPYGSGTEEHGVTAGIVRRITKNLRLNVKYGFSHYTDALAGGHRDFDAHFLFSSLQYRF